MPTPKEIEAVLSQLKRHQVILGPDIVQHLLAIIDNYQATHTEQTFKSAKRKLITVLFADISGFTAMSETMDPEDVTEIMNALWGKLDNIILSHGGHIDKHIGDAVMALWGVHQTREDDAERAVRAGLAMQNSILEFCQEQRKTALKLRIGIHSGTAILGHVGTTAEFTAMGDTVNTASRLEYAAPLGGVLISHDTHQLTRGLFAYEEQKKLSVKGKAEQLRTYIVSQAMEHGRRMAVRGIEGVQVPMIGREEELKQAQVACHEAIYRQYPGMINIVGEPGIGKTLFMEELEQWLSRQPHPLIYFKGMVHHEMQFRPYALIRDMLLSHWQMLDPDLTSEQLFEHLAEKIKASEAGLTQAQINSLGQLLGLTTVTKGDKGKGQALAESALIQYLNKISEKSVPAWFIEDIHWVDVSSLSLLSALCQGMRGRPMVLVTSSRPEFWEKHEKWRSLMSNYTLLKLSPLCENQTREFVRQVLQKMDMIPPQFENLLVENSHGNPLYVEELIHMFIADDTLNTSAKKWFVNPMKLSEVRLPPTLSGIIQSRLDSLPASERKLLQLCAIVGETFWSEAARYLDSQSESPTANLSFLWQKLLQRDLIVSLDECLMKGKQYAFSNPILHEVTYESVLKQNRSILHEHVAQWLIDHCEDDSSEHFSLIAEHLEKAHNNHQAIIYLRQAGEQAQQTYGFQESIHFFKRALGLLALTENHEERVQLTREIGRAMINMGQWDNAKSWLQDSLDIARQSAIPQQIVTSLQDLTQLAQSRGEYQEAMARIDEGLNIIKKHKVQIGSESSLYFHKAKDGLSGLLSSATDKAGEVAKQQAEQAKKKIEQAFTGVMGRWKSVKGEKDSQENKK